MRCALESGATLIDAADPDGFGFRSRLRSGRLAVSGFLRLGSYSFNHFDPQRCPLKVWLESPTGSGKTPRLPGLPVLAFTNLSTFRIYQNETLWFKGYKTSILNYLDQHGLKTVTVMDQPYGSGAEGGFPKQLWVRAAHPAPDPSQMMVGTIQGAALGVAGGINAWVSAMGSVVDAAGLLMSGAGQGAARIRSTGRVARRVDRTFSDRVLVEVTPQMPPMTNRFDNPRVKIESEQVTLATISGHLNNLLGAL